MYGIIAWVEIYTIPRVRGGLEHSKAATKAVDFNT
jgi:hypothetical protein